MVEHQQRPVNADAETSEHASAQVPAPDLSRTLTDVGPSFAPAIRGKIGQYRLRSEIASGGMGTVYEAVQENPRRTVAVKVLKQGITSPSALRRFEYESQILARLRHPGIAQVYESGMHDDGAGGVPYFAMEYIAGAKDIVAYADSKSLSTRERLELFIKVCEAVHHGHQKGIIHRDLKPANILVDSSGQPKIIDFGVARATDSDLAVTTLQTQVGQLVGTVQYMSPEQIDADPHDIDTRSDVYELGVVLYKLLTDKMPYDVSNTPVYEATRVIKEQAPHRPSTFDLGLRGDVETIVLHALEKERERRYQSAAAFAQDIHNYLNNQPIAARPASLSYVFRTFARRNKALVGGIAAVFICLVAGIIGTTMGMKRAQVSLGIAQREAASYNAMLEYWEDTFASLDPRDGTGPDTKVRELLDTAAGGIDLSLGSSPEVSARMHAAVGTGYRGLTLYPEAEAQFTVALERQRKILGDDHPVIAELLISLGAALYGQGLWSEAAEMFDESLGIRRAHFGEESLPVADSLNYLAAARNKQGDKGIKEAEQLYEEALAIRQKLLPARDELIARSMNNLGTCLLEQGRFAEAESRFRAALDIVRSKHGRAHIDVAGGLNNLGRCAAGRGDYELAEDLFRDALQIKREEVGLSPEHSSIGRTLGYLADMLEQSRRWADAEAALRELLEHQALKYARPEDAWRLDVTRSHLGRTMAEQGRLDDAIPMLDEAARALSDRLGRENAHTVDARAWLADARERAQDG